MFKRLTLLWLLIAFSFGSLFAQAWTPSEPGNYTLTSTGNGYRFKVSGDATEYTSIGAFTVASGTYTITFNTSKPVWLSGRMYVTHGTLNLKLGDNNKSTTSNPTLRRLANSFTNNYCIQVYNNTYASGGAADGKLTITGNTTYQFCIHGGRDFTINSSSTDPSNWKATEIAGTYDGNAIRSILGIAGGTATLKYVTLYNSYVEYSTANYGGAITANGSYGATSLTMTDCTITKCYSATSGGALLASSGFLTGDPRINISMTKCTISNCFTASSHDTSDGGTIRCAGFTSAKLTMNNCTISDNVAINQAGGVAWITGVVDNAFTLKNCTFSNNKTGSNGGGCNLCGSGSILNCTFEGNYAKTDGGGLIYSTYVSSSNGDSGFINFAPLNGTMTLDANTTIKNNTAGNYGGGVCFKVRPLNVRTPTGWRTVYKNNLGKQYETSLVIDGTKIQNNTAKHGGGIFVQRTTNIYISNFNMNYGSVQNNESLSNGGGIYVQSATSGTIYEYDGPCPYSPSNMDVVFGETGSTYNMYVQSNTANGSGGGVYVTGDGCNVKLLSGYIGGNGKTNTAKNYGGGIYVTSGNVTVKDATVSYNKTLTNDGGGMYVTGTTAAPSTVTISGTSKIYQNTTETSGGGIYMNSGTMTVSGGSIYSNTAKLDGGGVYMNNGTMTVSGGSIYSNTATQNGGGIYANGGTMTVTGGSINTNTATQNGGGIYTAGTITVENGTINGNAAAAGGGVYIPAGSTLNMYGAGNINNNHITGTNGGGVYQAGTMNVAGSSITVTGNKNAGNAPNNVYLPNYDNVITIVDHGTYHGVTDATDIGISIPKITDNVGVPVIASEEPNYLWGIVEKLTNPEETSALKDDRNMYQVVYTSSEPYNDEQIFFVPTWQAGCAEDALFQDSEYEGVDPILISTNKQLAKFMCYVNGLNGFSPHPAANGKLMADVDMDDYIWLPIGTEDINHTYEYGEPSAYSGIFDGNGHVITGLWSRNLMGYFKYGLFGETNNATVKNTFVIGCDFYPEMGGSHIGCIIGDMTGGTLAYSEGVGNLNMGAIMGGLVGVATGATIHSSMAMANLWGYNMGGLVGQTDATTTVKNCFANSATQVGLYSKAATEYYEKMGGLVGENAGTVENCYVLWERMQAAEAFKFVCENTGTIKFCYAPSNGKLVGEGTAPVSYGIFHAPKAPYYYADQTGDNDIYAGTASTVNSTLTDALNAWVSDNGDQYTTWRRTMAGGSSYSSYGDINHDYPIPTFDAQGYTTVGACAANDFGDPEYSHDGIVLDYFRTIDQVLTRHNQGGILAGGTLNLYKNDVANTGTSTGVKVYIDENVSILQSNSAAITAVTCQTMRKPTVEGSDYWHLISSSLSASPTGFNYANDADWQDDVIGELNNPCNVSLNSSHASSLFPTDAPVSAFDLYSFSEPYYHWINLKRNSNSHWHMNAHSVKIPYGEDDNLDGNGYLIPGKGYLAAIDKAVLLEACGTLNNRTVEIPVTIKAGFDNTNQGIPATEGTELMGYNLLGNPYQSYLSFAEFAGANSRLWDGTPSYVVYDPVGDQYIPGSTDTPSSGSAAATGAISMHQGFFIVADYAETVIFTNDMRTNDPADGTAFRGERPAFPLINLMVKGDDGTNDVAVVEFDRPEYSAAAKMKYIGGNGKLYFRYNNEDCALLYLDEDIDNLPVRFETVEDGAYTLTWSTANATFSYLHLIDNMKGMDIDMLTSEGYTFQSTTSDYASRFKLVFAYTGVEEESETATEHFAFVSNGNLIVNGTGMFEMIDMNGRTISATRLTDALNTVALPQAAAGVYVLRLTDSASSKVQKVVIR